MSQLTDVLDILKRRASAEVKAQEIVDYFAGPIYDIEIRSTHQAIETVKIYDLEIGVDANGRASEIHIPSGADW